MAAASAHATEVELRNVFSFLLASLLILLRGKKKKKVVASVKFLEPKIKYGKETQTGVSGGGGTAAPKPGRG